MKKINSSFLILALFFVSQITKAQNDIKTYDFKDLATTTTRKVAEK